MSLSTSFLEILKELIDLSDLEEYSVRTIYAKTLLRPLCIDLLNGRHKVVHGVVVFKTVVALHWVF